MHIFYYWCQVFKADVHVPQDDLVADLREPLSDLCQERYERDYFKGIGVEGEGQGYYLEVEQVSVFLAREVWPQIEFFVQEMYQSLVKLARIRTH